MDVQQATKKIEEAKEKASKRKFKQSLELSVNFQGIDIESTQYKLNLNMILPKGRGKDVEIGVFADGDMNIRAKKLSNHVLSKAEIDEYSKNKRKMRKYATDCYLFIAQPDLMAHIGKTWGIVLGPRGKMPQPVPPSANLDETIKRIKNTVKIRSKKNPTVQIPIGSEDMSSEDLAENLMAVVSAIERQIPEDRISSMYVKATMGSPVRII